MRLRSLQLRSAWRAEARLALALVWLAGWLGLFHTASTPALAASTSPAFSPTSVSPTVRPPSRGTPSPAPSTPRPANTPEPQPTACRISLSRLSPPAIPADRTTVLTVTGAGFAPRSLLRLGQALTLSTTYISSTMLAATVPPGLVSTWYTATLTTRDGCATNLANAVRVGGPGLATVTLNGGALTTAIPTITVGVAYTVAADASRMIGLSFSDDGASWTRWRDYATSVAWTLPLGEGLRTVYVRGVDWVGNVSPVVSATISLEPESAAFTGVIIEGGQYFARAITTTLTLGAKPGTAQMQVSHRPDFARAKWEPYAWHRNWVITPTVDLFTPSQVYVRYRDLRGKVSPVYHSSIFVDSHPPQGRAVVTALVGAGPGGSPMAADSRSYSFSESRFLGLGLGLGDLEKAGIFLPLLSAKAGAVVTAPATCADCLTFQLDLSATDDVSGVGAVRVSSEPGFGEAPWQLYTVKKLWTAPAASGTVYVEYRDIAGNISPVYTATLPAAPALALPRQLSNHLGTERVALADYMMWYGPDTFSGKMTWDVPAAGPYNSGDPAIIRQQVAQTQQACLDGLAAHWYGPTEATTTKNFDKLLEASAGTALRHAIVIQTNILPGATEAMIADAINYVSLHWAQHPNYLRLGGRPLLIFTDMPRPWDDAMAALAGWERIRQATDPGHTMIWMAEGLYPSYNPLFDGLFIYRIDHRDYEQGWLQQPRWAKGLRDLEQNNKAALPLGGLYFADSVSPGFDNTRLANSPVNFSAPAPEFARDRRDGGYYGDTFAVTAQTGGDFLLVKSFNEWIEGTEIEPGLTYGDRYLDLTCQYARIYRGR